ncbi:HPP family protein [Nocardia sp. NPDC051030]|uniref:HPP family protein n=1 Tax=Nocardia sp. NPDC051030 TaxID=3155162 RepID=UPI0034192C54
MTTVAAEQPSLLRRTSGPVLTTLLLLAPLAVVQALTHDPFFAPPLAASAAVLAATPALPAAKPWTLLIGHGVSVAAGVLAELALGPGVLAAFVAIGVATAVMVASGRMHAPAVASAGVIGAVGSLSGAGALLVGAVVLVLLNLAIAQLPARFRPMN